VLGKWVLTFIIIVICWSQKISQWKDKRTYSKSRLLSGETSHSYLLFSNLTIVHRSFLPLPLWRTQDHTFKTDVLGR